MSEHDKPNPENRGKDAAKRGLIVIKWPIHSKKKTEGAAEREVA